MKNKKNYINGNLIMNFNGGKINKRGENLYDLNNNISGFHLGVLLKENLTIFKDDNNKESFILSYNAENDSNQKYDENIVDAIKLSRKFANDYGVNLYVSKNIISKSHENKENIILNYVFSNNICQPIFLHEINSIPSSVKITIKPPSIFYENRNMKYHISQSSSKTKTMNLNTPLLIPEEQKIFLDNSNAYNLYSYLQSNITGLDNQKTKIMLQVKLSTIDKDYNEGFNLSNVILNDSVMNHNFEFEYIFKQTIDSNNKYIKINFETPKIYSNSKHIFNTNEMELLDKNKKTIVNFNFNEISAFNKENDNFIVILPRETLNDNVKILDNIFSEISLNGSISKLSLKNIKNEIIHYKKFDINLPDYLYNVSKLINEQRKKIIFNQEKFSKDHFYDMDKFIHEELGFDPYRQNKIIDFTENYKDIMQTIINKYIKLEQNNEKRHTFGKYLSHT